MESKYTPGPWYYNQGDSPPNISALGPPAKDSVRFSINIVSLHHAMGGKDTHVDAHRIVACVNACEGLDDPADLRRQRDELLAVLESTELILREWRNTDSPMGTAWSQSIKAIARATPKD